MSVYAVHYQNPKFIFIINYKVMYSGLSKILPENFPAIKFYNRQNLPWLNFNGFQKFAIVRNPFSRAVSAYVGKCHKTPLAFQKKESDHLQRSQYQLLNTIKVNRGEKFQIVKPGKTYSKAEEPEHWEILSANFDLLTSITFEEYLHCLGLILKKKNADGHFLSQYQAFLLPRRRLFYFPLNVFDKTEILRLEEIDQGWKFICQRLRKNMVLRKLNSSDHLRPPYQEFYTPTIQKQIADIYEIDFKKLGYPSERLSLF